MKIGIHLNPRYWLSGRIESPRTKEIISDKLVTPFVVYSPLQALHFLGVDAIQCGVNGYTSPSTLRMLENYGNSFSISFHGKYESPEYNLASDNSEVRRHSVKTAEHIADIAKKMGTFLVIHPGGGRRRFSGFDCTLQDFYKSLEELCDKGLGEAISVETKPNDSLNYVLTTAPEGLNETEKILELFPVNVTLDVPYVTFGHEDVDEANEHVRGVIKRFGQRINCVQCSEIRRGVGNHLGIGGGTIDWLSIIKELKSNGYNKDLILEVRDPSQWIPSIKKLRSMVKHVYN